MSDTAPIATFASPPSTILSVGVAGAIVIALLAFAVGMGFANGQDMTGFALFTVVAVALLGAIVAKLKFGRTILFGDRIERHEFFRTASMHRSEITGFRLKPMAVELIGREHQSLRITSEVLTNADFRTWILTLTDFEAAERDDATRALEARGGAPENTKLATRVATVLCLAAAAWAWYAPSLPATLAASAAPPIVFALALWSRGAAELLGGTGDRDRLRAQLNMTLPRSPMQRLVIAWMLPALVPVLQLLSNESQPPFNPSLVVALFIPMIAAAWVADAKIRTVFNLAWVALILLGWAWGASVALQQLFNS